MNDLAEVDCWQARGREGGWRERQRDRERESKRESKRGKEREREQMSIR